ncbi:hypothetical protein [Thalassospira profundimaris]|uniref:Uncharacterized protein n=1 Tax=Thalassospira profundimaris TaxID=502049 RepID=A0A367WJ03_9PROT|nr:hypothetical protein [Thalassospira profundimaris]RCK41414.1 hypothetical protein TH30_22085 [Thalassospira profundimaris]
MEFEPAKLATQIAGNFTGFDWLELRDCIQTSPSEELWLKAYNEFLMKRLTTRYIYPIQLLMKHGEQKGEGYSIVSIQCALIEFLAAFRNGLTYKFVPRGQLLGKFEYSGSKSLYVEFLTTAPLFSDLFDEKLATDFYVNIRCALLHEARTKNGWRIRASGNKAVCKHGKIVYRDTLQYLLESYLACYKDELLESAEKQQAFIRKFDSLCE